MDEDTIILRPKIKSAIFNFVVSLAAIAIGINMILSQDMWGWLVTTIFGISVAILILQFILGSSYLKFTPEGFTIKSLFRSDFFRWLDIDQGGFQTIHFFSLKMVGFNLSNPYKGKKTLGSINKAICGYEAAFPNSYGMSYEELCDLLNEKLHKNMGS